MQKRIFPEMPDVDVGVCLARNSEGQVPGWEGRYSITLLSLLAHVPALLTNDRHRPGPPFYDPRRLWHDIQASYFLSLCSHLSFRHRSPSHKTPAETALFFECVPLTPHLARLLLTCTVQSLVFAIAFDIYTQLAIPVGCSRSFPHTVLSRNG